MPNVSLLRLYLLRIGYLFLALGMGLQIFPSLISTTATAPFYEGVADSMLGALSLVALLGIVAPLRMLPLLVFEVAWKVIWFAAVAFPRWQAGTMDETIIENLFAIGLVVPFLLIIPWRYFAATVRNNVDRWR